MSSLFSGKLNIPTQNLLLNGRKVMVIRANNVRLIDSLNFLTMKLEEFTVAFELGEIKKGNTKEILQFQATFLTIFRDRRISITRDHCLI